MFLEIVAHLRLVNTRDSEGEKRPKILAGIVAVSIRKISDRSHFGLLLERRGIAKMPQALIAREGSYMQRIKPNFNGAPHLHRGGNSIVLGAKHSINNRTDHNFSRQAK